MGDLFLGPSSFSLGGQGVCIRVVVSAFLGIAVAACFSLGKLWEP